MPQAEAGSQPKGPESVHPVTHVPPAALVGPFGLIVGVSGVATFYLAPYVFPFLLSAAAAGLGFVGLRQNADRQAVAALSLGAAGLLLEVIALALAR